MNIFKILASGDGNINEPNVSAFLGYLLDPNEDHGIGDGLLRRLLEQLYVTNKKSCLKNFMVDKYDELRNFSINSNFKIEVLLEQAFHKEKEKKEIVDIVILCYEKRIEKKESLAKITLSNNSKGELKQIFLIENKINDHSTKEGQLINQAKASISVLKNLLNKNEVEIKNIISLIFLSPEGEKSSLEFARLVNEKTIDIPKVQLFWSTDEIKEDSNIDENDFSKATITGFLKQILKGENDGEIDAINEHTKFTIKSFINFIQNDFKSRIEEELMGQTVRDIDYNFNDFKLKHSDYFTKESWEILEKVDKEIRKNYSNLDIRYSPTHPISIAKKRNGREKSWDKIFSLTKSGNNLIVHIMQRHYQLSENNKTQLIDFLKTINFEITKEEPWGLEIKSQEFNSNSVLLLFDKFYRMLNL